MQFVWLPLQLATSSPFLPHAFPPPPNNFHPLGQLQSHLAEAQKQQTELISSTRNWKKKYCLGRKERLLMPQRRIHCPSHFAAASLFSDHTGTSQLASMSVPDVLALPQLAGQNTEVENMERRRQRAWRTWSFSCTGHRGDGRELGTGTMVSEIKGTGRSAQQRCGELDDVTEDSQRHREDDMAELCWERFRRHRQSWDDSSEWVEDITPKKIKFNSFYCSWNNLKNTVMLSKFQWSGKHLSHWLFFF